MDGKTTVRYLQEYLKAKDFQPGLEKEYFLKLTEEVGELAAAMRKGTRAEDMAHLKGSIDEEVWDVIYYALCIANLYDIDLEQVISAKEEMNRIKYGHAVKFEENR